MTHPLDSSMCPAVGTRAQINAGRTACSTCHDRKVKCDAHDVGIPCSNCRAASTAHDCRIHQKRKRQSRLKAKMLEIQSGAPIVSSTPAPIQPNNNNNNNNNQLYEHSLPSVTSPATSYTTLASDHSQYTKTHQFSSSVPSSSGPREHVALEPHTSSSLPRAVSSLAGAPLHPTENGDFQTYLVEFIDQPQITQRPIDGAARVAYIGTEVSNMNFLVRQQFGSNTVGINHYPTNRLPRRHTCHEPDRLPIEAFQLPSKAVVDELLDAYFTHVNPTFPVVDYRLFMAQYRAKDPQNPPSLLLLHAILVAGAHVLYKQPERDTQKALFFRRAKTLFDARFERNRDTVVQAVLLLTWHADGAEDALANAWFWIGVAVRTAMGLGMHRDTDNSTMIPQNRHMWRRVWWLLFQCDVMVSLQYGRPQAIRLQDCDIKRLHVSDFEDCGPQVQVDHCIQQTELCIIVSRSMEGQFSPSRNPDLAVRREERHRADQELATWLLQQRPSRSSHGLEPHLHLSSAILQLLYNTTLVLLHRQHPGHQDLDDKASSEQDDTNICSNAAVAIQHIFEQLCERDQLGGLWVFSVNCLFTALIQLSVQVKTSNPVVAISAYRRYESALSSMRQLVGYWPNAISILHFFESFVRAGLQDGNRTEKGQVVQQEGGFGPHEERAVKSHNINHSANDSGQTPGFDLSGTGTGHDPPLNPDQTMSQAVEPKVADQQPPGSETNLASPLQNSTFGNVDDILEAWQEWQRISEYSDDFLFTF